tara:strand:+ start:297 stop:1220 length:924 start_codon:yes stop_codon:yes gene_type:complete
MKFLTLILLFNFFFLSNIYSIENKIILKIENEIITSLDIANEISYLEALNPNIKNLKKDKLNEIAKNSLIRENIKKNEILKYIEEIKLDQKFLSKLIKDRYSRLNLTNKDEFLNYLKNYNVNIKVIEKKISLEALWNQLIFQKFSQKVKINKENLLKEIDADLNLGEKNFLLSEIIFTLENKKDLNKKYSEIKDAILKVGFENAALTYSISDSSNLGGKLGWIKESSLNKIIQNNLAKLDKNEITNPIFSPNGYIVLKIDDIKFTKKNYDKNKILDNLIKSRTNQQLNQFSTMYFNKIKKNTNINEL